MASDADLYRSTLVAVHDAARVHLDQFVSEQSEKLQGLLALEADLGVWLHVLDSRPEVSQYRSAHRDLGLALYSVASGLYRQAFAGLRSFIEVSFGALHLSSAELERRRWVSGRRDLSWSEITSTDGGIYAPGYLREFMPSSVDEAAPLIADVKAAYRRCSEYMHGNVATTDLLPAHLVYASKPVEEWKTAAKQSLVVLHHSLFVRYYQDLSQPQRQAIESTLEQHLSNHLSVREALGLPIEES